MIVSIVENTLTDCRPTCPFKVGLWSSTGHIRAEQRCRRSSDSVHQLFGPHWNPECNSHAIRVWLICNKSASSLGSTHTDGATQLSVLIITAWRTVNRQHEKNATLGRLIIKNIITAVHFSRQMDPAWQQPEVKLSSTSWSDAQKTHTTCQPRSTPATVSAAVNMAHQPRQVMCSKGRSFQSQFTPSTNVGHVCDKHSKT